MIVSYCIITNVLNFLLDRTIWHVLGASNNVLHWADKVKKHIMQYVEERRTCFDGFYVPVHKTPKYLNVLQERGIKKMGNENGSSNIKFKITRNANKEHIKLASSP